MSAVPEPLRFTAEEALARLIAGNERFVEGKARFPTVQKDVLAELARGQQPFATILGCSDSRVPPELVFDAGFGDLFIVRLAGNVVSAAKSRGHRERERIVRLLDNIIPGLNGIDPEWPVHEQLGAAVEANVRWSMQQLLETPEAKARQTEGVLKLVGAVYELKTGHVRILP